jgi:hypothetical protein
VDEVRLPNVVTTYLKGAPDDIRVACIRYKSLVSQISKISGLVTLMEGGLRGTSYRDGLVAAVAQRLTRNRKCLPAGHGDPDTVEATEPGVNEGGHSTLLRDKTKTDHTRYKETDTEAFNLGLRGGRHLYVYLDEFDVFAAN